MPARMEELPQPTTNAAAPRRFPLVVRLPSLGAPLMLGILAGMFALEAAQHADPSADRIIPVAVGLGVALVTATVLLFYLRRQTADAVRITDTALELSQGPRTLRRVLLAKLTEVSE